MIYGNTQLYEVMNLLLSCRPQKPVDAILMHARSFGGDDDGLFELVRELVPSFAPMVVINGGDGRSMLNPSKKAWPGVKEYQRRLSYLGVTEVMHSAPALHTQEESEKFTDLIVKHNWKRVIVANLPHYLLRTMLGAVKQIQKRNVSVALYPAAPTSISWNKTVFGSQGSSQTERLKQCREELKKVVSFPMIYPQKFVSVKSLIGYLSALHG